MKNMEETAAMTPVAIALITLNCSDVRLRYQYDVNGVLRPTPILVKNYLIQNISNEMVYNPHDKPSWIAVFARKLLLGHQVFMADAIESDLSLEEIHFSVQFPSNIRVLKYIDDQLHVFQFVGQRCMLASRYSG